LINVFGDIFDDVICLPMGSVKKEVLLHWKNTGLFWIEDYLRNAEDGYDLGLKSILITNPTNAKYETNGVIRVSENNPWEEIYNLVMQEYNL
jgi:hypothetical protein